MGKLRIPEEILEKMIVQANDPDVKAFNIEDGVVTTVAVEIERG